MSCASAACSRCASFCKQGQSGQGKDARVQGTSSLVAGLRLAHAHTALPRNKEAALASKKMGRSGTLALTCVMAITGRRSLTQRYASLRHAAVKAGEGKDNGLLGRGLAGRRSPVGLVGGYMRGWGGGADASLRVRSSHDTHCLRA